MNENIFKKIIFNEKQNFLRFWHRDSQFERIFFTNRKEGQMKYLYKTIKDKVIKRNKVMKNKVIKKIVFGANFTFSFSRLFSDFFLRGCLRKWFSKEEAASTIKASWILAMISMILFLPELALAADHANAFGDASKAISDMLKGTLGKTIALSSLTLGVVSSAIRFNAPVLLGSAGVAAAVGLGPGIIDKLL